MKRRELLGGGGALFFAGRVWGKRLDKSKLKRIGVMTLSFDSALKSASRPASPTRTLAIMDFADMIARRYGIHNVEYQQTDFDSTEPEYFQEFRNRVARAKSRIGQINLEFANLNISAKDPVIRLEAVDLTKSWIDHAVTLGCPRVMVNQGNLTPEFRQAAIETLRMMTAYAKTKNVAVTLEPRWRGDASNVPWRAFAELLTSSGAYANPDCGNFPDKTVREAALPVFYRMTAGSSHVKHIPDKFDTAEAIRIAKEAGYRGLFAIEERGFLGSDPYAAVQTVRDFLLANL